MDGLSLVARRLVAGSLVTGDEEVGGGPLAGSLVTSDEEVGGAVAGSLVTADEENPPPKSMLKSCNIFFSSFSIFQQPPSARSSMTGGNNKDKKRCEK